MSPHPYLAVLGLTGLLSTAVSAAGPDDEPSCPWTANDPALLARLGIQSPGPFPFAHTTSGELRERLPSGQAWLFVETAHLRLASNLPAQSLNAKDRARFQPYLERLAEVLPDFPKRLTKLDPHLRLYLLAMRAEDTYRRVQGILGVTDADFPEDYDSSAPFMGLGPYLGEKDKFELIFHARRSTHSLFTQDQMGFVVTDGLRWHFSPEHKLCASIPAEDSDLAQDRWLHPHSAHVLAHLLLSGYKHLAYDPPVWIDEGLAHMIEREIEPVSTTIDGEEGGGPHRGGHEDWTGKDLELVRRGKAPTFAQLLHLKTYGEMDAAHHISCWSVMRFLAEQHPAELARFLDGVKSQRDERGIQTGADLPGLQRRLLREIWDWTPDDLDAAWRAWLLE